MKMRSYFIGERTFRKQKIRITIFLIICVIFIIAGFVFSNNTISKPLTKAHFEYYEQIAHNVYSQKEPIIINDLEGVILSISSTEITVKPSDFTYRGYIIAKLQNEELFITRYYDIVEAIVLGFIMGMIFLYLFISLYIIFQDLYEKFRFRNNGKKQ